MRPDRDTSRRQFLHTAGLAGLGLASAPGTARAATPASRIRSCILVFYYGGPSHFETLDPKPDAPAEIRGEYRSIATAVPGVRLGEHLPRTARLLDRFALVRSMHHPMRNHNSAAAEALTGRTPAGGDQELLTDDPRGLPTLGSAVSYALRDRANVLPYVALPYTLYNVVQLPGQTAGLLGGGYDRFQVEGDPNNPDFRLPALDGASSLDSRAPLLRDLDRTPLPGPAARVEGYRKRALRLLASPEVRRLFSMNGESARVRERYGRHRLGQSLLLARRLVEGGVNFVAAFDGQRNGQEANWDSHENLFNRHRQLIPPSDQAVSALIEDLDARGLLEKTLVIALGEFGRTPRINKSGGRDHWPDCYSLLMAGGGVSGGAVYGSSDKIGAYPAADAVTPADLAATIYWRFGFDPETEVIDQTGRPFRLSEGTPIYKLFGG
ncbi:MAG TPA: DUF1501 domain-containing protein [Gemmataceae bacterium]|nr:DUF1501 domain-containing protein [Gemmataceae bacterium]